MTALATLQQFLSQVQTTGRYDFRRWLELERAVDHMVPEELDLLEHTLIRARRARRDRQVPPAP